MDSKYIFIGLCFFFAVTLVAIYMLGNNYSLKQIKNKPVGNGQYGTAKWIDNKESKETYEKIYFDPHSWRKGKNLPNKQGVIVGCIDTKKSRPDKVSPNIDKINKTYALVDTADIHTLMIGASGIGKTAFFLYPNLEYACACGMSFFTTDTKGDLYKNMGYVAEHYYGYKVSVIDLRNPMKSDEFNILSSINKYMDMATETKSPQKALSYRAKAEKYAKITSKTIIYSSGEEQNFGQNQYFYDAAEGLITATILLISEFGQEGERHIVSVFKLIQDLLEPSKKRSPTGKTENKFKEIMNKLPSEHKARWFAGAALTTADQSMQSVLSTAMAKLNAFLDSELEQLLCFDTTVDIETFCNEKCAIFLVLPEEDPTKYFIASLYIQTLYREFLVLADEAGGKLKRKIMLYLDEIGTIPKIQNLEKMFSAIRSRNGGIVAIIQSFAQFEDTYGEKGAEIVFDNCQLSIFGGFAPNSKTAQILSENLGTQTVLSGSVNRETMRPGTATLQMMERRLMNPDELKSLKLGNFIVTKTGSNPMKSIMKLFLKWKITFEKKYVIPLKENKTVKYIDVKKLEELIIRKYNVSSSNSSTRPPAYPMGDSGQADVDHIERKQPIIKRRRYREIESTARTDSVDKKLGKLLNKEGN